MSDEGYFELFPTIMVRASTMEEADRMFCDVVDGLGDDFRCFGWTTIADADGSEVFAASRVVEKGA